MIEPVKRPAKQKPNPYTHSLELEHALIEFHGERKGWYGSAGGFQNPAHVRKAIQSACRRMRSRIREIATADDRLLLLVELQLGAIERNASGLGRKEGSEVNTIAALVHLCAFLLGFDWHSGKPNRHVAYYQTREQQFKDDQMRHPKPYSAFLDQIVKPQDDLIIGLHKAGKRVAQISMIMHLPESVIKDKLVRSGQISRSTNVKKT